jgi:predicted transglutaminase-like cysteine proteinase
MPSRASIVMLFLVCMVAPSWAAPRLKAGPEAPPLVAWVGFCERKPAECAVESGEAEIVVLTKETVRLLASVNRTVNRSLKPMTDEAHWGVADDWNLPRDGKGDCEDYQLLKRRILAAAGLPRRALRMTVVLDAFRAGHAVLTVVTDKGDLILDNLTDAVLPWSETNYTFIQRESAEKVGWVFLESETERTVVASAQK